MSSGGEGRPSESLSLNYTKITMKYMLDDKGTLAAKAPEDQARLDKDFQLFYSLGDKDVGVTALSHRPVSTEDGYFMMLMSPKVEMSKDNYIPRDLVLVLDTSGSMHGVKMDQARKAWTLGSDAGKEIPSFRLFSGAEMDELMGQNAFIHACALAGQAGEGVVKRATLLETYRSPVLQVSSAGPKPQ